MPSRQDKKNQDVGARPVHFEAGRRALFTTHDLEVYI
jgi:hypothetical protein